MYFLPIPSWIFGLQDLPKRFGSSNITNLACNELITKIVWSSFIHRFVHFTHKYRKHIWHMNKCVDKWSMNLWMNECHTNFASSFKFVCQMCFQSMILMRERYELWMNEFCMIFVTKSWDVKFVMKGQSGCNFKGSKTN
jgi:hypothetical protein